MAAADELRAVILARIATVSGGLLLSLVTWLAAMIHADVRVLSDKVGVALQAAESVKEIEREALVLDRRVWRLEIAAGIHSAPDGPGGAP